MIPSSTSPQASASTSSHARWTAGTVSMGVQVLLKLAGGLGPQAQSQGGLADGGPVEIGGLKDHGGGVVHNFGILAAHDAGQADGLVSVGNHQHPRLQGAAHAVQGDDGLALCALPHHNFTRRHVAVIKGVHRLAVFQHDIVGDVHNVVDGPHTVGPEPLAQPLGRGADFYMVHHPGGVPVAQALRRDLHVQPAVHGPGGAAVYHRLVAAHRPVERRPPLPGQAR